VLQFFQADQRLRVGAALPDDVGRCRVVRDPVDPGTQRALLIPACKTPPKGEVNFLAQVAALIRIGFITTR
jgi:hypothetical protein